MTDPILERRERLARLAAAGQRTGYIALLVAVIAFFWALIADFPRPATVVVTAGMALCTITLAPAIVLGYAVKAAQREDEEGGT
jgi:hypothetical protein